MGEDRVKTVIWREWMSAPSCYIMLITEVDGVVTGILFDGRDARAEVSQHKLESVLKDPISLTWWDVFT